MNNKYYGKIENFAPIKRDGGRVIASYEMTPTGDGVHCTWFEVYFHTKQHPTVSFDDVKTAILDDINHQTDEKILSGFVWNDIHVWLSDENQRNYSEADRKAKDSPELVLPITFKLGEDADKNPVYHTFETYAELDSFYMQAFRYINQCLNEGWARKDAIDWNDYSVYFPVSE